ncbi:hypothetical protein [Virgibacillus salexigens]|uniref:Uncharacterized protein n=1 Tax=Virgibacillus massiliensis TaxID=1462526 RepID=A0A024QH60_9BACI|nr:hypothetical protein [Virgibacillus massiliensis]CDQ41844.1 hypothetical protein BN990_04223 [Virgibacillus massiliensis]
MKRLQLSEYKYESQEYKKIKNKRTWWPTRISVEYWWECENRSDFKVWHDDYIRGELLIASGPVNLLKIFYDIHQKLKYNYHTVLLTLARYLQRKNKVKIEEGVMLSPKYLWKKRIKKGEK